MESGNGLLPDGTKPLPGLMFTDHHWSLLVSRNLSQKCAWQSNIQNQPHLLGVNESTYLFGPALLEGLWDDTFIEVNQGFGAFKLCEEWVVELKEYNTQAEHITLKKKSKTTKLT